MSFEMAVEFTLQHEGGYSDHPADRGGPTLFGLSRSSYPDLDFNTLTLAQARLIYRRDYWDDIDLDSLPPMLAVCVFDLAVNAGPHRAITTLQKALNQAEGLDLGIDGLLGPATRNSCWHLKNGLHKLIETYLDMRIQFYLNLVKKNPGQKVFLKGWMNRVEDLRKLVLK